MCIGCPIVIDPSNPKSIQCAKSDRDTEKLLLENAKQQFKTHRENAKHSTSITDNMSDIMKKCINKWNLLPPYNMECNWNNYWNVRNEIESAGFYDDDEEENYPSDEEDGPTNSVEKVKSKIAYIYMIF